MAIITPSHRLERILESFSENQLRLIMDNVGAIQLTEGCNSACPDCGVGALPGVRDFIPFKFLERLFSRFSEQLSQQVPLLYFASEPFDYCDGKHTYEDVHAAFKKKTKRSPAVITSLPKGNEKKIMEYIFKDSHLGGSHDTFVHALSITRLNYFRIERCLLEMIPQLEPEKQIKIASSYQLKVCSRYDEMTKKTIILSSVPKERLVLNLDDIVRQLGIKDKNTFYLNGVNSTTTVKPLWKTPAFDFTDENCRRSYAKLISVPQYCSINPDNTVISNGRGNLYIVQLPNKDYLASESKPVSVQLLFDYLRYINFDDLARGTSIRDYRNKRRSEQVHSLMLGPKTEELSPTGIGCFHGTILTPSGAYNLQTRIPTRYYPYGLRIFPITPDNFNVAEYCRLYSVNKKNISHMAKRFKLLKQ